MVSFLFPKITYMKGPPGFWTVLRVWIMARGRDSWAESTEVAWAIWEFQCVLESRLQSYIGSPICFDSSGSVEQVESELRTFLKEQEEKGVFSNASS